MAGRFPNCLATDFIAATEYLVANKFMARDWIIADGGSAGGLLMGAIANLRPDLYAGIIAEVPFVDVLNTILDDTLPLTPQSTYTIPTFDIEAWLVEMGLMLEWYLPDRGVEPSTELRNEFTTMWRNLLAKPAAAAKTWAIRDFHSPNIIWLGDRSGILRVGIIDFQDAVMGPAAYDVVSLLQDARIDIPEAVELTLLTRYIKARRAADANFDPAGFAELYAIMSAQRNTRLLGTFARLNRRDGKPQYLRHQPRIWTYLNRSLAHPALSDFREWYAANVPPPVQNP